MFHYLYILRSEKYNKFYIGFTSRKLNIRLEEHNSGKVSFTSKYLPWKLVYFEGYLTEAQARNRERMLKQYGSAWQKLKKRFME